MNLADRPEYNSNINSSHVKRTDAEYKAELARIKAAKAATVPRYISPSKAAQMKSDIRVTSKVLG